MNACLQPGHTYCLSRRALVILGILCAEYMQSKLQIPAEEVSALCTGEAAECWSPVSASLSLTRVHAACYATFGTTMAGLEARSHMFLCSASATSAASDLVCKQAKGYKLDYDDWHAHVHGKLPYNELLQRDPQLEKVLRSIPLPKWVFTNGDIR